MRAWLSGAALTLLALNGPAWAGPPDADAPFRVEWSVADSSPSGVRLQGYVYNDSRYLVTNVRLRIVSLDESGRAVDETFRWVFGDVPAGGRAVFAVPFMPAAPSYRLTVIWFDRVAASHP